MVTVSTTLNQKTTFPDLVRVGPHYELRVFTYQWVCTILGGHRCSLPLFRAIYELFIVDVSINLPLHSPKIPASLRMKMRSDTGL